MRQRAYIYVSLSATCRQLLAWSTSCMRFFVYTMSIRKLQVCSANLHEELKFELELELEPSGETMQYKAV